MSSFENKGPVGEAERWKPTQDQWVLFQIQKEQKREPCSRYRTLLIHKVYPEYQVFVQIVV